MQRDNPRRSQRKRSSYKVEHLPTHGHSPGEMRSSVLFQALSSAAKTGAESVKASMAARYLAVGIGLLIRCGTLTPEY